MELAIVYSTPSELKLLEATIKNMKTKPSSVTTHLAKGWKEVPVIGGATYVLVPSSTPFHVFNSLRAHHDILTISENEGKFKRHRQWAEAGS